MSETLSQEIVRNAPIKVTDKKGRIIEVRKLKTLDRMRLLELVGAENSANQQYLGFAMLAYSVSSIGGNPIGRPGTKLALEAIVQELDDDGFDAISKAFVEHFSEEDDAKDLVKNG